MVLDILFKTKDIEMHPIEMFIYSFLVSCFSAFFALIIFSEYASIIFPFLITIALLPPMRSVLKDQEKIDEEMAGLSFFEKYKKIVEIYFYFFVGVVFCVIFLASFIPQAYVEKLFIDQVATINAIREEDLSFQGKVHVFTDEFLSILFNNLKVLAVSFSLSFFFGTGALFILSWNASVIGVFISLYARTISSSYDKHILISHLDALSSIALHGIPEIIGYFFGGIAGAILSFGLIEGNKKDVVIKDALKVFALGCLFIVIGAFLESF